MNKKAKTATMLPKYRFPEFIDTKEWHISTLKSLTDPIEKRAGAKKYTLMSITSGVGLITQKEKFGKEIAGSAYKNYIVIQRGDFAYNKSATKLFPEGYIAMLTDYDEAALPNSIFTCFRITDEQVCTKFLDHIFQSNYHGSWLRKFIAVGARAHGSLNIDDKHLWEMPVTLPELPEQQKIADCLTSLNELIAAENKKLETLKVHKKALMQKLFPAEGKTVPEWRFPEFRDSGEWEEKILSQCLKQPPDYGISASAVSYSDTLPLYLRITDISEDGRFIRSKMASVEKKVTDDNYLEEGDIVFARTGASVGKSYKYNISDGKLVFAGFLIRVKLDTKIVNPELLYQFLSTEQYWRWVKLVSARSGQPGINSNEYSSMPLVLPKKLKEQQKIAYCLSSLDDWITAQADKIEALKLHKKGLMQGLFPSVQEVIG